MRAGLSAWALFSVGRLGFALRPDHTDLQGSRHCAPLGIMAQLSPGLMVRSAPHRRIHNMRFACARLERRKSGLPDLRTNMPSRASPRPDGPPHPSRRPRIRSGPQDEAGRGRCVQPSEKEFFAEASRFRSCRIPVCRRGACRPAPGTSPSRLRGGRSAERRRGLSPAGHAKPGTRLRGVSSPVALRTLASRRSTAAFSCEGRNLSH